MRKFVPLILKLSVLLVAISVISQQVTATKGDVERALELLKQARAAIGGDSAINSIQNLSINGKTRHQFQIPNEAERTLNGEFELNMMMPDRFMRMEKLTHGTPGAGSERAQGAEGKELKVKEVRVFRDAENSEVQNAMRHHERSEMARYMLGLLLTPPPSFNATYNYLGEGDVGGSRADIIEAQGAGGFVLKIFLDKSSHLPLMMSYQGSLPRIPFRHFINGEGPMGEGEDADVVIVRRPKEGEGATVEAAPRIVIERAIGDDKAPAEGRKFVMRAPVPSEDTETQIRFSDFRSVGGVLLPHVMTQYVGGKIDTVWTVERYDVNLPNINEKFQKDVLVRTKHN
jgi:hypothetical protein